MSYFEVETHGNRLERLAYLNKKRECNPAPTYNIHENPDLLLEGPRVTKSFRTPPEVLSERRRAARSLSALLDQSNTATPQDIEERMRAQAERFWRQAGKGKIPTEWRTFARNHRHLIEKASKNH